jgi:hypothetical protein
MGWETRWKRRYYYRARRIGNRVGKEYFGSGPAAELAASLDAEARRQRQQEQQELRQVKDRLGPLDRAMQALDDGCRQLTAAVLYDEGYYQHSYGQWRRRRQDATRESPERD